MTAEKVKLRLENCLTAVTGNRDDFINLIDELIQLRIAEAILKLIETKQENQR